MYAFLVAACLSSCAPSRLAHSQTVIATALPITVLPIVRDTIEYKRCFAADSTNITYPQGGIAIDSSFTGNREGLSSIANTLRRIRQDSTAQNINIQIVSYTSPEGTFHYNMQLSQKRSNSLKQYLQDSFDVPSECIVTEGRGEDWAELDSLVSADNSSQLAPYKEEVLRIIREIPILKGREKQLMMLNRGKVYRYLFATYFLRLRRTVFRISWEYTTATTRSIVEYKNVEVEPTVVEYKNVEVEPTVAPQPESKWSVRTNLLYDAVLLPNLAVECRFATHWSAVVEGYWSWWQTKAPNYWSHRIQIGGAELRYRFKNKPHGHHLGIYSMAGTYDIRLFPKSISTLGYLSDWSYSCGLSYGYRWSLFSRWLLEAGIGIGYLGGRYKSYNRTECANIYRQQSVGKLHYYGPTRVALSLTYNIGGRKAAGKEGR